MFYDERKSVLVVTFICELWIMLPVSVLDGKYVKTSIFGMDQKRICRDDNSVTVDYLEDTESALILAKTVGFQFASKTPDCNVILGPESESSKQYIQIEFESYHMPDCDVELIIRQCPYITFNKQVTVMNRLGCDDKTPKTMIAEKKHSVKFTMHRETVSSERFYNFRINVTLTDSNGQQQSSLSIGLKIGIIAISIIAAIIVGIMVFKAVRLKLILRSDYNNESDQERHHVLHSLESSHRRQPHSNSTDLTDQELTGSQENQYMNIHPLEDNAVEIPSLRTLAVPQESERHTYANTQRHRNVEIENHTQGTASEMPDSPPSYEDALNMPQPHQTTTEGSCPTYQNL